MSEHEPNTPTAPEAPPEEREPGGAEGPGTGEDSGWRANLQKRVMSGVPALLVVLAIIGLAPTFVVVLITLAVGVYGAFEFHQLLPRARREALEREVLMAAAGVVGLGALLGGLAGMNVLFYAAVIGVTVWVWLGQEPGSADGVALAGSAVLGLVLVPWVVNHVGLTHGLPGGPGMLAFLVLVVVFNDSAAYLVGSLLGSRLLWPRVSPNKTVEGALAGLVGGVLGALFMWIWLLSFPHAPGFLEAVALGVVLAALAQAGDLFESKLKRLSGVAESGTMLPGHGGLLDRIDSFLFTAPVLFYYLLAVQG